VLHLRLRPVIDLAPLLDDQLFLISPLG